MRRASELAALVLLLALPGIGQELFAWKDLGDGRIELREGGRPAIVYNYGPQLRNGAPGDRRRCCYVFPVYTPAGVSLLDDFPPDHWHHRGLFWSWPVIETDGKTYDNWMAMTAKHRPARTPKVAATSNEALLEAHNFWQADGRDIVRENLRLRVFAMQGGAREIELQLTWEALKSPVTLRGSDERGKSYGGLSARFADREHTVLRADDKALEKDEDLNPRRWAELEGVYGGRRAMLRITPDPKNPGVP
ncbi:MAG: DUF6807 family protein, partial [Bryobacteraceae bacterium]